MKGAGGKRRHKRPIDSLSNVAERVRATGRLGQISSSRAVNRLADALYHAQLVEESLRFAGREVRGRPAAAIYRPRGRQRRAKIRHRSGDLYVLNEIVRHSAYDFPPHALQRLAALDRPPRILDVGANIGLFGIEMLTRFPRAVITAFEPDPANADVLEDVVRINGLQGSWAVIRSCAGTKNGTAMFAPGRYVSSRIESSRDAIPVPIADIFPYIRKTDLLKMDIEGSEWPILSDPRLQEVEDLVLVAEYHEYTCPYRDARRAALDLLTRAGFTVREANSSRQPEGTGMVWAWKVRV
jgi:FkbM family methyltransferase